MLIEIEVIPGGVKVREAADRGARIVKLWDDQFPGSVHDGSGMTYAELCALGTGFHEVEKKPLKVRPTESLPSTD